MTFSHSGLIGGTGPIPEKLRNRQKLMSLNITDNINENYFIARHYIDFCRPLPNDHFNCTASDATPGTADCGIFTKDLKDFPLNNLPSGGACTSDMRISPSEMAYVYVEFDRYPAGNPVTIIWRNRDTGQEIYSYTVTLPPPDPSWTWWYYYTWSYIGHFSWEIVSSGNYQCIITTPYWGNAIIDFVVINSIGTLAIASTPNNARVWIDNVDKGVYTPATVPGLAAGDHSYKLVLTGYTDLTGSFTIIPESTTPVSKIVKFKPSAYFTSTPTHARIWLDNNDTGIYTPATFIGLTESTHSYKLVLAPYPDASDTFPATAGSTAAIPITFLQGTIFQITASNMIRYSSDDVFNGGGFETTYSLMKEIILAADYQGSIRIYYEDLILWLTGSAYTQIYKNEVPWGTIHNCQQTNGYNFTAVSQDFTNVSLARGTRIQIYGNKTKPSFQNFTQLYVQNFRVEFDLPPGNALFTSTPVGARIWIDGVDQGTGKDTPYTITGIQPYSRNYTLKKAGYADKSGTVQIEIGLTTSVSETLIPYKEIAASNIIRYNDNATGTITGYGTGSHNLIKVKEIIIPAAYIGSWRIYFEMGCVDYEDGCRYLGLSSRGQIYKDDIPLGTLQSTGTAEWCCQGFSEDFTNINIVPGTKIQLYIEDPNYTDIDTDYQNFRIMFDLPVNTITLSPTTATIDVGNNRTLTVECRDELNNVVTPILTWSSSDSTIATINPNTGLITGISSGIVDITGSSGGKTSNPSVITISLLPPTLDAIMISAPFNSVVVQYTLQFTFLCKDQYDTQIDCPILTWESSNPLVATIDSTGLVAGILPGTTDITAIYGSITSNALTITVDPQTLANITIFPLSTSIDTNTSTQLTTTCRDLNNNTMVCPTLTWESSNSPVATVDSTGLITGIATGMADITATYQQLDPPSGLIASNISTVSVSQAPEESGGGMMVIVAVAAVAAALMMSKKK